MNAAQQIIDSFTKNNGIDFDRSESFRKLSAHQFGGSPARGFCELIQNAIDSYDDSVPIRDRVIRLSKRGNALIVSDCGEGLTRERLALIMTLGGTDKKDSSGKIGQFGIGFFSIFNPALGTRKVDVVTRCEGQRVRLSFLIDPAAPDALPTMDASVTESAEGDSGSEIQVTFEHNNSISQCLSAARDFLQYIPCRASIDGEPFSGSVWEAADAEGSIRFGTGDIDGFVRCAGGAAGQVMLLRRYEHIMTSNVESLLQADFSKDSIEAYRRKDFPFVLGSITTVNCNGLKVTVSRDSVYINSDFERMLRAVRNAHWSLLFQQLRNSEEQNSTIANQYVLSAEIRSWMNLQLESVPKDRYGSVEYLAQAKVYRIAGEAEHVSLADIALRRAEHKPVFLAPSGDYSRWTGEGFDYDFVVIAPSCAYLADPVRQYDELFEEIFEDIVNLSTIRDDPDKLDALVARGLIDRDMLCPKVQMRSALGSTKAEILLLEELNELLAEHVMLKAISESLHIDIKSVTASFFELKDSVMSVATGLFDESGAVFDNIRFKNATTGETVSPHVKLGLMANHPVVKQLVASRNPNRAFFALTFLAHELIKCQHQLSPYSSFHQWVMSDLMKNMRAAITDMILDRMEPEGSSLD